MRKLVILAVIASIVTGCCWDIDEVLLGKDDISVTMKGEDLFVYDPMTCQISFSSPDNIYRMYDDRLSDWVIIKCSDRPDTEGQNLIADVTWTASSSTRTEHGLKFTVQKTSADGKVWLWNKSKKIGIVIKNL
jgi:hypothetical protein